MQAATQRPFGVCLAQSVLPCGAGIGILSLRQQQVTAAVEINGVKVCGSRGVEQSQALVVLLFVEQQASQTHACHMLQLVVTAIVDYPLQLGLGRLHFARIKQRACRNEGAERRIRRSAVARQQCAGGIPRLGLVARCCRCLQLVKHGASRYGLTALVIAPAVVARNHQANNDDGGQHEIAALVPPGLQFGQLFLFLQVECCHLCVLFQCQFVNHIFPQRCNQDALLERVSA